MQGARRELILRTDTPVLGVRQGKHVMHDARQIPVLDAC